VARDLSRLLRPKSIAVVGGGFWCRNVITQCRKMGFTGDLWPVNPKAVEISGVTCFRSLCDLPAAPDASFIGVNRHATIDITGQLRAMNAGGAVCFASGFLEAEQEDKAGAGLQQNLLDAAGDMPILGPNCYGFINYLDGVLLWPDQHGGAPVQSGVAIVTQSSNIAINLTMQTGGLPIAYMATAGNQAQIGLAEIGQALLYDRRVTALGLHIEGFGDVRAFEALAATARSLGKPIIALKVGKSEQAQAATVSHTASLAGGDAGAQAFLDRLGIARLASLPEFLETLKFLHICGPLPSGNIASISCSGGEASLMADSARSRDLKFPDLTERQKTNLRGALGPMVALANPLDYHTYIWTDTVAMTRTFAAMMDDPVALTLLIVDFPRSDRCSDADWECAIEAAINARAQSDRPVMLVSSLHENLPESVADRLIAGGVVPIRGLDEALAAAEAAARLYQPPPLPAPALKTTPPSGSEMLNEAEAKKLLSVYGLATPLAACASSPEEAAQAAAEIGFPVVLKGEGIAHKTDAGAVKLNLQTSGEVRDAAGEMPSDTFLVEKMVPDTVAELLVGVVRDPAHGFVLTLAAGGVLTEILQDTCSLLLPVSEESIVTGLNRLKISRLLQGYRGKPAANMGAIVLAIQSVQSFATENADRLVEVEINPLMCGPDTAVAADVLIKIAKD
jgi:acyl-CoA synthetase (NDP forming)